MSFDAYRGLLVAKLASGEFSHEPREAMEEKNLLAVGDVSAAAVARLLRRCTSQQYATDHHHRLPRVVVHVFRPVDVDGGGWYIKAYFLRGGATFISVHR
jgi:hypothetical protein